MRNRKTAPVTLAREVYRNPLPSLRGMGWASVLALSSLLMACGGEDGPRPVAGGPAGGPGAGGPGGGGPGGALTPVETGLVRSGTISRQVTVSGNVEPLRTVGVISQLAGALLEVAAEEGDRVREDQLLARLDDRELAAQVRSAEASVEVTRRAYQRAEQLRERQVITEAEYERDRAALDAAEAQLDQLRTRLEYTRIQSPLTGVMTEKRVEAGDVVGAQTRLFTVADLTQLVARVAVSELDVVALRTGDPVTLALDAFPGQPLTGTIRRVFPAANPENRLVPVEVALGPEAAQLARPGFLARVTFSIGSRDGATLIPSRAVVRRDEQDVVFVLDSDRAIIRPVRTGGLSGPDVEVLEGLTPGERVVVVGANQLRDGSQVRDMTAAASPAGAATDADSGQVPLISGGE